MAVNDYPLERDQSTQAAGHETLTLGMGCFWGPEALFGHLAGVHQTRTGYAGGTLPSPVYRQLGDHSETVEIEFDPSVITLEQLLELFWNHHHPAVINGYKGRQYYSLLFYRNEEQLYTMQRVQQTHTSELEKRAMTEIQAYRAWYPAEERHQKYYLQRQHEWMNQLRVWYPDQQELLQTTLAARLNGYSRGHGTTEQIQQELSDWSISDKTRSQIEQWLTEELSKN